MHLGLDLVFLVPGETGGRETYARELLRALRGAAPDLRVTAFLNRETASDGPGVWSDWTDRTVVLPRASGRAPARWALGELVGVARAAARASVDVLHSPANFGPAHGPFARVLTVHDVLWRTQPHLVPPATRWATDALVKAAARRAHEVITVSAASHAAIVRELGVSAERVEVIHNGLTPPVTGDGTAARARLGAGSRPIALSVATNLPHKNLAALLDALAMVPVSERPLLVVAGAGTDTGDLAERAGERGVDNDVRLLGRVSSAALEDLYAGASVLVTATLEEGFGIPVLEAMARGIPVACSDLPALREVAGDAAHYVDPRDPTSIATAIRELLTARGRAEQLRTAGLERARGFTWEAAAATTLRAYDRAVAARGGRSG